MSRIGCVCPTILQCTFIYRKMSMSKLMSHKQSNAISRRSVCNRLYGIPRFSWLNWAFADIIRKTYKGSIVSGSIYILHCTEKITICVFPLQLRCYSQPSACNWSLPPIAATRLTANAVAKTGAVSHAASLDTSASS